MIRNDVTLLCPLFNIQIGELEVEHFLFKKAHQIDEFLNLASPHHILINTIVFLAKAIHECISASRVYDTFPCTNPVNLN